MVRGWRTIALVLAIVPLAAAGLVWFTYLAFDAPNEVGPSLLAAAALGAAALAYRGNAGRFAPLWGLGAAGSFVLFFVAIGLVLIGIHADEPGGCPGSRVYC